MRTNDQNSGNSLENGAYTIKLADLYAMIKYKRDLVFEVMIDENQQFMRNALKLNNLNPGNQAKIGYGTLSID